MPSIARAIDISLWGYFRKTVLARAMLCDEEIYAWGIMSTNNDLLCLTVQSQLSVFTHQVFYFSDSILGISSPSPSPTPVSLLSRVALRCSSSHSLLDHTPISHCHNDAIYQLGAILKPSFFIILHRFN